MNTVRVFVSIITELKCMRLPISFSNKASVARTADVYILTWQNSVETDGSCSGVSLLTGSILTRHDCKMSCRQVLIGKLSA